MGLSHWFIDLLQFSMCHKIRQFSRGRFDLFNHICPIFEAKFNLSINLSQLIDGRLFFRGLWHVRSFIFGRRSLLNRFNTADANILASARLRFEAFELHFLQSNFRMVQLELSNSFYLLRSDIWLSFKAWRLSSRSGNRHGVHTMVQSSYVEQGSGESDVSDIA